MKLPLPHLVELLDRAVDWRERNKGR